MPSRKTLVVVNLRGQPVEILHGGEVIVVAGFGQAELPALPEEGGQLAELARQGAVALQSAPAAGTRGRPQPPQGSRPAPLDRRAQTDAGPQETIAEVARGRNLIVATNIGLNVIEVDGTASAPLQGAAVSVGAFNVLTRRGVPNRPARVTSFTDFTDRFGGFDSGSFGAYLVKGFFDNGGQRAYVNRVAGTGANAPTTASATIRQGTAANSPALLTLEGGFRGQPDPGTWSEGIQATLTPSFATGLKGAVTIAKDGTTLDRVAGFAVGDTVLVQDSSTTARSSRSRS